MPEIILSGTPTIVNTEIDWSKARFTMGADPELIFANSDGFVPADRVLAYTGNGGSVEYEDVDDEEYDDEENESSSGMGTDGHSATGEIRPKYGWTPIQLVRNIQTLFANACYEFPTITEMNWLAGAYKHSEPIGGHIHFGIYRDAWDRMKLTTALDLFLSCNIMQLEIQTEARERKESYGRLGDVRNQDWGTEYRSPSSWIHSPALALAVLSLAKHIVNQPHIKSDIFAGLAADSLYGVSYDTVKEKYRSHDVRFFRESREKVWEVINSWPVDPDVKDGLEIFKTMLDKNYRFGFGDFKKNWGLRINTGEIKRNNGLQFDAIWEM